MKKTGYFKSPIGYIIYVHETHKLYQMRIEEDQLDQHMTFENDDDINKQLDQYFKGSLTAFDLDIVFESGTDFQRSVWNQLLKIPFGKTKCYQEISELVGSPHAMRAVGQACKKNPIGIVVPCHRVIGKNNQLTGYSGKDYVHLKKKLLDMEKAFLD